MKILVAAAVLVSLTLSCGRDTQTGPKASEQARVTVVVRCGLTTVMRTFVIVSGDTVHVPCPSNDRR